jgi:hypothetical protein
LESLDCEHNQFTATTLNALFGTQHTNVGGEKGIKISYNPGTKDCDISIAEKKGWKIMGGLY